MVHEHSPEKLASATLLPALYETQHRHWWSVGMRAITHAILAREALPPGPILEIGCGGGAFLRELATHHPSHPTFGADLNPAALVHARQSGRQVLQADLHRLPVPANHCAALIALDSFDQRGVDLAEALREAERVLRPGGLLLLRVSAYDWLRGPHDVAFGTGRRYSAGEVEAAMADAHLAPARFTYANSLLLLPAIAVRLAQQSGHGEVESQLETPAPLNALLAVLLRAEATWLRHRSLPVGLSLYGLVRKRGLMRDE